MPCHAFLKNVCTIYWSIKEKEKKNFIPETHLAAADQSVISQIREDLTHQQEMITDHGYTGNIDYVKTYKI